MLNDLLGEGVVNKIMSNQVLGQMINKIIANKGFGDVYNQGLGSILPKSLQKELEQFGLGSLLGSRGLHNLWQKGILISWLKIMCLWITARLVTPQGELNFVAGKSIIFNGEKHH